MQVSVKFFEAMMEAGLTESALSRESGVARSTISKMIRDQIVMPLPAYKVCRVLTHKLGREVTPQDLGIVMRLPEGQD